MSVPARPPDAAACVDRVSAILQEARARSLRAVNAAMVAACWEVGREIVEEEQRGAERAEYGAALLRQLAARLKAEVGRGYSVSNLKLMRQFYLTYRDRPPAERIAGGGPAEIGQTPSGQSAPLASRALPVVLSWSHWTVLLRVSSPEARAFYEVECARSRWSVRELDRQVSSLLFERLAASRDKEGVLSLARDGTRSRPRLTSSRIP